MTATKTLALLMVGLAFAHAAFPTYDVPTYDKPVTFTQFGDLSYDPEAREYSATYMSQGFPLGYGEVVFTDPQTTFLTMPTGDIGLTSFVADVADGKGNAIPLDEAYLHHWLVFDENSPNEGVCGGYLAYHFGVGAESRNTVTRYPDGYGQLVRKDSVWGANIHILRTVNLKPLNRTGMTPEQAATKSCIECTGPNQYCTIAAGFACCPNGGFCPTNPTPNKEPETKTYHLRYTVTWKDVADIKPVGIYVLDASDCQIEYNINSTMAGPDSLVKTQITYPVPGDTELLFAVGHVHIAGVNITLSVDGKDICTSVPTYGTEPGVAGNELGYLTEMSACTYDKPLHAAKGSQLTVTSYYTTAMTDPRTFVVGPFHGGVMSLFYLAVAL